VGGIVTRADMQKTPVRMWMFGLISMLEMQMQRVIESAYPDNDWLDHLEENRRDKARRLYEQRVHENEYIDLIDCLEFSDKKKIFAASPHLILLSGEESATQFKRKMGRTIELRNYLAHPTRSTYKPWGWISRTMADCQSILTALTE
jgi:hypothetical protein